MKITTWQAGGVYSARHTFDLSYVHLEKRKNEKRYHLWLIGILAIGMLFVASALAISTPETLFLSDNGTWTIARNLVSGRGYTACDTAYFPACATTSQVTAMREPVPVLLMAVAMLIFPSAYSGVILQGLLYLGTTLVIYTTLKDKNHRVALLAALLWTISLPVITELNNDSGELAAAFFLSLGLFQLRKGWQASSRRDWLLAGIFMGLAALSRTVLLGVAIGLGMAFLVHGLWGFSSNKRERISHALAFLLMVGLVFAPWLVRNTLAFGQPVLGSTLTGYNVFRMNSILASGNYNPHYVGAEEGYAAVQKLVTTTHLSGLENEAQMQDVYTQAGLQIIQQHPLQYIGLSLYRFLVLWFNTSVKASYHMSTGLKDVLTVIQQAFLLLAVLAVGLRKFKRNWPLLLILILGSGAYMAIGAQLRYLVDFMPAVVILAAQAIPTWKSMTRWVTRTAVISG